MKKRIVIITAICLVVTLTVLAVLFFAAYRGNIDATPGITADKPAQTTAVGGVGVTDAPSASGDPQDTAPVMTAPVEGAEGGSGGETPEAPTDEVPEEIDPEAAALMNSNGSIGTLSIPAIDVNVQIFEGTDAATLDKGAGHFGNASVWTGNVCVAGHNRGANCYFGDLHKLKAGDEIIYTTRLGTRTYAVTGVTKVLYTDLSGLAATQDNTITLYTCVRGESDYRWCVKGVEIV